MIFSCVTCKLYGFAKMSGEMYLCFTHPANTNARLNKVFINYVYSYGETIKLSFLDLVCQ